MISVRFRLLLAGLLFLPLISFSQVTPPDFLCVSSDTLFWNAPDNDCGDFIAVNIFSSDNPSGPFAILDRISDPGVTFYEDGRPGQWYYYLTSEYNCPDAVIPSDTLDNRAPSATRIIRATVEGDNVRLLWEQNTDPETVGYVIYRSTAQGTLPIDTVFGALEYLDQSADPTGGGETYNVVALDACGNQGDFDVSHTTIHLEVTPDFCAQHLQLTWSNYEGWQNGRANNQVWLGIDGGDIAFEHNVGADDTLAYLLRIMDDIEYCLQIRAEESETGVISTSNTICLVTDVLRPLETLGIRNVTVNRDNTVEVIWNYDSDADVTQLGINRGSDENSLDTLQNDLLSGATTDTSTFVDQQADVQNQAYFYQLHATDQCDTSQISNVMSTMHLDISSGTGGENQLQWTTPFMPGRIIQRYTVCRVLGGVETSLAQFDTTTQGIISYTDVIDPSMESDEICYVIKATHTNLGGEDPLVSTSNYSCIEQKVEMYVPNAFVPGGVNNIFKPEIVFQNSIREYTMSIFNRWGGKVFESKNPDLGWDGRQNGELLPVGVYMYVIMLEQAEGESEHVSGTVTLIR